MLSSSLQRQCLAHLRCPPSQHPGIEPSTSSVIARHANHLSYESPRVFLTPPLGRGINFFYRGVMPFRRDRVLSPAGHTKWVGHPPTHRFDRRVRGTRRKIRNMLQGGYQATTSPRTDPLHMGKKGVPLQELCKKTKDRKGLPTKVTPKQASHCQCKACTSIMAQRLHQPSNQPSSNQHGQ